MISTIYHKKVTCYVIDNNTDPIEEQEGAEIKIFKNERKMLTTFIADFKETDPDFIAGWNAISFDLEYIYNRLPIIKISRESFSKFGEFYVDGFRYICNLPGCVVLDQLFLYKSFTFTKKENYKLGTIGEIEVKETKIKMEFPINEMYYKDINTLIKYNIRDSVLLDKLEDKLGHINLLNELRIICNSSFDGASSPFGQVDSIIVSFLREKGFASKNSNPHVPKKDYPGAFVLEPTPGVYDNAADLDYTALYPSLIMTYNIGVNNFVMRTEDPAVGHDIAYDPDSMSEEIAIIDDPTFEKKRIFMKKEDILKKIKDENLIHTINGCFFKNHSDEISVYSQVLESLLSGRRAYKKKMFDAKEAGDEKGKDFYNTKQMVYKVLANSLYGVIANKAFRFFDINCAAAITLGGQETLKTSIIEGDAYMKFLAGKSKDPLEGVTPVNRVETYSRVMPDRNPKYIITGDTDSIFICFEKFPGEKDDDTIRNYCIRVQDYLNSISIQKTIARHNVPPKYNKLELKNELVIKRGLFLAKKFYCMYVTNQEGRSIDEVVYMGIAVKRSDTPSHTKVFLKELLDIILKSESFGLPLLFKFINQKEKEFIRLIKDGSKTVAKPVGWNKPLKEYKSLPEGVRGMANFNEVSYPIHSIGNRGYLFHVSGIDLDKAPPDVVDNYNKNILEKGKKLDIVVVPDEEETLPDYYNPNVRMMLAKSFKERYELILKPLTEAKKKEEIMTI
jgi:DNA polymerase elongation subunit (family B)